MQNVRCALILAALATVVGLAYYLRLAAVIFTVGQSGPAKRNARSGAGGIAVLAALSIVVIGFVPGLIFHLTDHALLLAP